MYPLLFAVFPLTLICQVFFTAEFLNLSTMWCFGLDNSLLGGGKGGLCLVGCIAATLASPLQMPVALSPSVVTMQNSLAIGNVPRG